MKKLLLMSAAAAFISTGAMAQSTVVTTTGAGHAAVQIEPEYRTRIKSYVTEHKIRPVETTERIVVGSKVPTEGVVFVSVKDQDKPAMVPPWPGRAAVADGAETGARRPSRGRTRTPDVGLAASSAPEVKPARRPRSSKPSRKPAFGTRREANP